MEKKNPVVFFGAVGALLFAVALSMVAAKSHYNHSMATQRQYDSSMAATGSVVVKRPATEAPEKGLNGFEHLATVDGCKIYRREGIYVTTSESCSLAARN